MPSPNGTVRPGHAKADRIQNVIRDIEDLRHQIEPLLPDIDSRDFDAEAIKLWELSQGLDENCHWIRGEVCLRIKARIVCGPEPVYRRRTQRAWSAMLGIHETLFCRYADAYLWTHPASRMLFTGNPEHPYWNTIEQVAPLPPAVKGRQKALAESLVTQEALFDHYMEALTIAKTPGLGPQVAIELVDTAIGMAKQPRGGEDDNADAAGGVPRVKTHIRALGHELLRSVAGGRGYDGRGRSYRMHEKLLNGVFDQTVENIARFCAYFVELLRKRGLLDVLEAALKDVDQDLKADRAAVSNGQQERMIELPKEGQDVKDAGQAPAQSVGAQGG